MLTKICSKCKEELSVDSFMKRKNYKDGLEYWCKNCNSEMNKKRYAENKSTIREKSREDYKANKSKVKETCSKYYLKNREKIIKKTKEYALKNKDKVKILSPTMIKLKKEKAKETYKKWREQPKNIETMKLYRETNKEKLAIISKEYRDNNKERVDKVRRDYEFKNKGKIKSYHKKYAKEHPELFKASTQKRNAMKLSLKATLTIEQWKKIKDSFGNKCCYCGKTAQLAQEHFIPLSKGGEYTLNNIVPSCKSCNSSKKDKQFNTWYPTYKFYSKKREKIILKFLGIDNDVQQLKII